MTGDVCFAVGFVCLVILRHKIGLDTLAVTPIAFLISLALILIQSYKNSKSIYDKRYFGPSH